MSNTRMIRRLAGLGLIAALVAGTAACSGANDNLANQYRSGTNKNYIAGDGSVTEFAKSNLGKPVVWSGTTELGATIGSAQLSGVVVVLNFWYSGCAPCRAEAPDLVSIEKEFQSKKVQVVGVNVRDTSATTIAFERNFGLNYPSIIDNNTGSVLLAFTGIVTPQAVPTTIIIGRDGRVTSRILGRFDKDTLRALIKTAVNE
jgi:thiol-disulfide isomerase/thioredoxin